MKNPQDLKKTFDAAFRAATGYDLGKKADAEVFLAEQIEVLQAQIAELTTGTRPTVNYTTSYTQPPVTTMHVSSPINPFDQPPEQNPPVYYIPTTNTVPLLNRSYENPPTNNNRRSNNQMGRRETVPREKCFRCEKGGHIKVNC